MSVFEMWRTNTGTLIMLMFLNLGLFSLNNPMAWTILGLILLLGGLYLSYRQGMAYGHEACALRASVQSAEDPDSPAHGQVDASVIRRAWSVSTGIKALLVFALPPYLAGCLYIASTLLGFKPLILPMRLISWLLAMPYWPCVLPWSQVFDRLTGTVAAVLMISPFILPLAAFAGYMQGPKLWAKSEKAMAEGKRRAKAKSRVQRKKRASRA